MTIVLLLRHATTDYVQKGILAGLTPGIHLNAEGQRQAEDLARRLAAVPLEAVFSSPVDRALDTARIVALCHKLDVLVRPGLAEGDMGAWTGKSIKELEDSDRWKQVQAHPAGVKWGGDGETVDQVQARLVAEIDSIVRAHPEGIVAVVSHADPIKAVLAHYLKMDLNEFQRLVVSPASVSVLLFDKEVVRLLHLNQVGQIKLAKPGPKREPQGQAPQNEEEKARVETNVIYDLNPASHITAGAVGEPGHRSFFIQGRQGATVVTLAAEKEQVSAMATAIRELIEKLGGNPNEGDAPNSYDMSLREPLEPIFRVGQLGLGYDQETQRLVLVAYELPDEDEPAVVDAVRFWGTLEQMRGLARHAAEIVSGGRPTCVLCGRPIDPEGHFCPRRNGHGEKATLA